MDLLTMTRKARGVDPVARMQERSRWSSFTNSWSQAVAPGRAPRWVRRMIIAVFVLMVVAGVVGLIELLARDDSGGEPFNDCATHETTASVSCLEFTISPTVP
jgi:hypothetical protein